MSKAEEKKSHEKLLESHLAYQGKVVKLRLDTYESQDKTKLFELVEHPGAVVLLPIDPKGRILMIRQWRRAVEEILLELPAGTLEENEDPLFCAQRELQEETGFKAGKLTNLTSFYSAPGFCNEKLHLFLAEDLLPSNLPQDEDEGIDLAPMQLSEAIELIEKGLCRDAKTIASILLYQLWRRKHAIK